MDLAVAYVGTVKSLILYVHVGMLEKGQSCLERGGSVSEDYAEESVEQRVLDRLLNYL